jgi:hypothetical protein
MVSAQLEFHQRLCTEATSSSLQELLQPGWNGLVFKSSEELAGRLTVRP